MCQGAHENRVGLGLGLGGKEGLEDDSVVVPDAIPHGVPVLSGDDRGQHAEGVQGGVRGERGVKGT